MRRQFVREIDATPIYELTIAADRDEDRRVAVLGDADGCATLRLGCHCRLAPRSVRATIFTVITRGVTIRRDQVVQVFGHEISCTWQSRTSLCQYRRCRSSQAHAARNL